MDGELMKRRKRKLNEWMERAKEDLSNREQEEQERRTAIEKIINNKDAATE